MKGRKSGSTESIKEKKLSYQEQLKQNVAEGVAINAQRGADLQAGVLNNVVVTADRAGRVTSAVGAMMQGAAEFVWEDLRARECL